MTEYQQNLINYVKCWLPTNSDETAIKWLGDNCIAWRKRDAAHNS